MQSLRSSWHFTFSSSYMKGRPRVVISLLHIHRRECKPAQSANTRQVINSKFKLHKLCSEMQKKTWFIGGAVPSQSWHVSCVGRKQQVDNRLDLEENRGLVCGALNPHDDIISLRTLHKSLEDPKACWVAFGLCKKWLVKQNDS